MSRAVVLKLLPDAAVAAVVRSSAHAIEVEGATRVPLAEDQDAKEAGRRIAAALAPYSGRHAVAVVAMPRSELHWQNYDLPPAPLEDLPDLVHLQAQRDLPLGDDGLGFDFVSLHGDHEHPHRVIGIGLQPAKLERIHQICTAAELKLDRIVPEPFGWIELGRRAAAPGAAAHALTIFCAIAGRQAGVWASEDDSLRLVRTIWLPTEVDAGGDAAALAGELRRTQMSLTQGQASATSLACVYCGENAEEMAAELSGALSRPVRAAALDELVEVSAALRDVAPVAELAPLAALAAATAERRAAPLDLLHPHRRPAPPSRARTYVLAGVAAAALAVLLAWSAYRNVQAPLEAAAAADAERQSMAAELESLAEDEKKAAAIDAWFGEAVNLLNELDYLGQQLRPKPLASDEFDSGQDVVVTKLAVAGRRLTLNAAARSTEAVLPAESRLRAAGYAVDRGAVDPETNPVPGYAVSVSAMLERAESAAAPPEAAP
jgi:hypothetical protein